MKRSIVIAAASLGAIAFAPLAAQAQYYSQPYSYQNNNNRQVLGGLTGAVIGGVAGSQLAGSGARTEGSVLGAVVGGVAGAALAGNRNRAGGYYAQPTYYRGHTYNHAPRYYSQPRVIHSQPRYYSQPRVIHSQPRYGYSQPYTRTRGTTQGRVVGGLVGGSLGAFVGREVAGSGNRRDGAIVGGLIGGTLGTVVGDRSTRRTYVQPRTYGHSYYSAPRTTYTRSYSQPHYGGSTYRVGGSSWGHSGQANCPFGTVPSRDFSGRTTCLVR